MSQKIYFVIILIFFFFVSLRDEKSNWPVCGMLFVIGMMILNKLY
jgi:hypothetical protein